MARTLGSATTILLLLLLPGLVPGLAAAGERAPEGRRGGEAASASPGWSLDLGLRYGYFDREGRLETSAPGRPAGSDTLQLDGTLAGLHARVRLPAEWAGGRPFVQVSGVFDASDAEDLGGEATLPSGVTSSILLSYQAGLAAEAGLEWETPPLHSGQGLRIRPYGGLVLSFWDANLDDEGTGVLPMVDRDNEDFATPSGRLGLELGMPLVAGERAALDLVLGSRVDLPLGDAGQDFDVGGAGAPRVEGEVEIDESWAAYTGLELRWGPIGPL